MGGDILFARPPRTAGRLSRRPLNLSNSLAGDGKGRISRDTGITAALTSPPARTAGLCGVAEYEGALWFARSGDTGRRLSRRRSASPAAAISPRARRRLAQRSGSHVYLAWTIGEDNAAAHPRRRVHGRRVELRRATHSSASPGLLRRSQAPQLTLRVHYNLGTRRARGPFGSPSPYPIYAFRLTAHALSGHRSAISPPGGDSPP